MNILDPFEHFHFTHLDFCPFSAGKCNATVKIISSKMEAIPWLHYPDGITHIKNGRSFKKYSKFTATIYIDPNFYSFRIMFIMIIVRFIIICFINRWKYEKMATNWCIYRIIRKAIERHVHDATKRCYTMRCMDRHRKYRRHSFNVAFRRIHFLGSPKWFFEYRSRSWMVEQNNTAGIPECI